MPKTLRFFLSWLEVDAILLQTSAISVCRFIGQAIYGKAIPDSQSQDIATAFNFERRRNWLETAKFLAHSPTQLLEPPGCCPLWHLDSNYAICLTGGLGLRFAGTRFHGPELSGLRAHHISLRSSISPRLRFRRSTPSHPQAQPLSWLAVPERS